MTRYTIEQLMAMDNDTLSKAAREVFSMMFDPFSELGRRTMKRRLEEAGCVRSHMRISAALTLIIGEPSAVIEDILNYQDARASAELQTSA